MAGAAAADERLSLRQAAQPLVRRGEDVRHRAEYLRPDERQPGSPTGIERLPEPFDGIRAASLGVSDPAQVQQARLLEPSRAQTLGEGLGLDELLAAPAE